MGHFNHLIRSISFNFLLRDLVPLPNLLDFLYFFLLTTSAGITDFEKRWFFLHFCLFLDLIGARLPSFCWVKSNAHYFMKFIFSSNL